MAEAGIATPTTPKPLADPAAARRRAEQREARVAAGVAELDSWLRDQVRHGLAASQRAGYRHWDDIAARMVDAQAPGLAERLRALAAVPHSGPGWEDRLLEEYALLRLLAAACRDQDRLPPPLRDTVRSRVGFAVRQADVLASAAPVRDRWQRPGRAGPGRRPDPDPPDLAARPAHRPARAGAQLRRGGRSRSTTRWRPVPRPTPTWPSTQGPSRCAPWSRPAAGHGARRAAARHHRRRAAGRLRCGARRGPLAGHLARRAGRGPGPRSAPGLRDADGGALPLHPGAGDCWPLFALSGGRPLTVAGEWTPRGLWPLTAWDEDGRPVPL